LNSRFVFGLSGTAIETGLPDLYEILRAIRIPNLERPLEFFATHIICDDFGRPKHTVDSEIFFARHSDRILRRLKSEVASELPELRMTEVELPLSPLQETLSRPLLSELGDVSKRLETRFDSEDFARSQWLINRIVELSNSSALIDPSTNESSKLTWLREYLRRVCITDSEKVVIFTRWTRCQDLITDLCNEVGVGFTTLRGEDSVQKRKEAIERFKCDDQVLAFISTDAGGMGVNLQFARHIVVFEPSWNPSMDAQRIQRVHRIGQKRPVEAVSPLTYLDHFFVRSTHGRKNFSADAIDAVRSPTRQFDLPTWSELYPVIRHYHELAQQPLPVSHPKKTGRKKK
jgi:SNF2 family DNA or RNA helicase